MQLFRDPVTAADGTTYERSAIEVSPACGSETAAGPNGRRLAAGGGLSDGDALASIVPAANDWQQQKQRT
jgi:hypothetical protein